MSGHRWVLWCGTLSFLVYAGITWLSRSFVYGQGHLQRPLLWFVALSAVAFVLYFFTLRILLRGSHDRHHLWLLLGFAIIFRVTLLFSNPIQEDDFYRYLWDGKVVASGLNPYRVAPLTVLNQETGPAELQAYSRILVEDDAFALILSRVNHPAIPTIYPPLAQAVFGLVALVAPGSLVALRLAFLGFDLGICGLIIALLKRLGITPLLVVVYAWSPLVIKESINSAHYDAVPTFFLVLALWSSLKEKVLLTYSSLALAVLGKIFPLLVVPFFLWRTWTTQGRSSSLVGISVLCIGITLGYVPFLDAGAFLWQGTLTFAERWEINSLLFPLLRALVGERWIGNAVVAVVLGGMAFVLLFRCDLREERSFVWANFCVLGALFLLSPVGNPWYFLWIVPFLCVFPLFSWLLLSGLLNLYYLSFYFIYCDAAETFRWVIWLEYMPFYCCGVVAWWRSRVNPRFS
jgi:alpha-1,6-mannosyltransferase